MATLCLLNASSAGLLESELRQILGDEEKLMPPSPFDEKGIYMSRLVGKPTMWFPNRSDTTGLYKLYYPRSENKGADQLRGYREADLRLCFRICRLLVFSRGGSIILSKSNNNL